MDKAVENILKAHQEEYLEFEETGELRHWESGNLFDELFEHFLNAGEMPYGVAKARTGDPYNWIADQIS